MSFRPVATTRLGLDTLEAREVPAGVTAEVRNAVLLVWGTNAADRIDITSRDNRVSVLDYGAPVSVRNPASFRKVEVYAHGGNDVVNLSGLTSVTGHVEGGTGNDTIYGSNQSDTLFGGAGTDFLYGNSGDDWLLGGNGSSPGGGVYERDLLAGGPGFDTFHDEFDYNRPVYDGVKVTDVQQRESPTCQTLAALAAGIRVGADFASNISRTSTDRYSVTLYANGRESRQSVQFNGVWTDNDPAPSRDSQGKSLPEFWTILYQRARLQSLGVDWGRKMTNADWDAANARTNGRLYSVDDATRTMTGWTIGSKTPSQLSASAIRAALDRGEILVGCTPGSGKKQDTGTAGLVSNHCYAITGVTSDGRIQVYNPWGQDTSGTPRDGVDDGYITLTWSEFVRGFSSVMTARR